ncbi:MAG: hypothetical protein ACYTF0_00010 [Planctomycetota bacterium]|jgi:polyferredoxin
MTRLKRPTGLIRYASDIEFAGGQRRVLRARTVLYAVVFGVLATVLALLLANRHVVQVERLRETAAPQVDVSRDGRQVLRKVVNLAVVNKGSGERVVRFHLADAQPGSALIVPGEELTLAAGTRVATVLHLLLPLPDLPEQVSVVVDDGEEQQQLSVRIK